MNTAQNFQTLGELRTAVNCGGVVTALEEDGSPSQQDGVVDLIGPNERPIWECQVMLDQGRVVGLIW